MRSIFPGRYQRFNAWLANLITTGVAQMECAYLFTVLAILGFPGIHASPQALMQWVSQTFIQLVMLSVISVQGRLTQELSASHHQETQELQKQHHAELRQNHASHRQDIAMLRADIRAVQDTQVEHSVALAQVQTEHTVATTSPKRRTSQKKEVSTDADDLGGK